MKTGDVIVILCRHLPPRLGRVRPSPQTSRRTQTTFMVFIRYYKCVYLSYKCVCVYACSVISYYPRRRRSRLGFTLAAARHSDRVIID